jgi:hypothetical protein
VKNADLSSGAASRRPLQVEHADGDHLNNEISNLRILCANCHMQTDVRIQGSPAQAVGSSAGGVTGSRARLRSVCLRT